MLLELKKLKFGFDETEKIFENFSLCIQEREIIKLDGPNGSGKSTLLNLLTGICSQKKLDATIFFKGVEIQPIELSKHISYVTVSNQLFDGLTGFENIELISHLFNENSSYKQSVIDKCNQLGLTDIELNKRCMIYSSGMKQKLWLLLMLSRNTELYFIDEPFRALDIESTNAIISMINSLHGSAIIVVHENVPDIKFTRKVCLHQHTNSEKE